MSEQQKQRILVTGSSGLIGSQLIPLLNTLGYATAGMDIRAVQQDDYGDICDSEALVSKVKGCVGIVHLAAISRVAVAHKNPQLCMKTNYEASKNLAKLAKEVGAKWFIYASSREVYGHVKSTPIVESVGLNPVNVYGEAKLKSETYIDGLASAEFNPAIVRFSNVFGAVNDHATRVIPAFVKAAYQGADLSVEGGHNAFDFTFVDEIVRALGLLISQLQQGQTFKPMHFTTGQETSLNTLASEAIGLFDSQSRLVHNTPRDFDVSTFSGDSTLAFKQLGWKHESKPLSYFLRKYAQRLNLLSVEHAQEKPMNINKKQTESYASAFT